MLNKRKRHNNYVGKFKSHTDVNNYNNFLLELDKKHIEYKNKEIYLENKKAINILDKTPLGNNNSDFINGFYRGFTSTYSKLVNEENNQDIKINKEIPNKKEIDKIVKGITDSFNTKYKDVNFTGLSPWESLLAAVEKTIDPNLYSASLARILAKALASLARTALNSSAVGIYLSTTLSDGFFTIDAIFI